MDVLIVDDDATQREVLARHLGMLECSVRTAADGKAALEECQKQRPDIVLLDVKLPDRSGIEVCAALRARYQDSLGVMMVTGCDSELDVEMGFQVGADDYVIKPFRVSEVLARLKALFRRLRPSTTATPPSGSNPPVSPHSSPPPSAPPASSSEVLLRGRLQIEMNKRRVRVDGEALQLTGTEFELLVFLARRPERIYTRMQLLEGVWRTRNQSYERNVYCHITNVRKKLEQSGLSPPPIETVYGSGYRFVTPVENPLPAKKKKR